MRGAFFLTTDSTLFERASHELSTSRGAATAPGYIQIQADDGTLLTIEANAELALDVYDPPAPGSADVEVPSLPDVIAYDITCRSVLLFTVVVHQLARMAIGRTWVLDAAERVWWADEADAAKVQL